MELIERKNPPELILKRRDGTLSLQVLQKAVQTNLGEIPDEKRQTALGLLYLWHDHGSEAHASTDKYEGTPDSDYLHSLFHRREGDYSNSEYWLRETGEHPLFKVLGPRMKSLLAGEEKLSRKIIPEGKWDAKGFVRAVKEQPDSQLLREVQAEEFLCYLEWLIA